MNIEIKERIDKINNPKIVKLFFRFLKDLLSDLDLKNEDKRIALTATKENNSLTININSRIALKITKNEFIILGNSELIEELKQNSNLEIKKIGRFQSQKPEASLVYLTFDSIEKETELIYKVVYKSCTDYLRKTKQTKSQYRRYHHNDIYEISNDENLLNQYLDTNINLNIIKIIDAYKNHLKQNDNLDELYKWELIKKHKGRPNLNSNDFQQELKSINYSNLIYHIGKAVIKHLAKDKEKEFHKYLTLLFNESINLKERIDTYSSKTLELYRELVPDENKSHHQDERTISTLLTYYNPEKYTFYKSSFYGKYCKYLNIKTKSAGEKYTHYLELIDDLIENYIKKDEELITLFNDFLPKDVFQDKNYKILAQDILYLYFDGEISEKLNSKVEDKQLDDKKPMKTKQYLNQILYGPPGTGKTYHTINKAVSIIENKDEKDLKSEKRNELLNRFNQYKNNGQIVFTTFHQSMGYEDFVEGIKPETFDNNVIYNIKDGLFKHICNDAQINTEKNQTNKISFEEKFQKLIDEWQENEDGKLKIETARSYFSITNITSRNIDFEKKSGSNKHNLVISTLKQLYKGEREMNAGLGVYYYPIIEKLNNYDISVKTEELKNFVLIIDEINRGNVSAIFGELITLIEKDKRAGNKEALSVKLPYSQDDFSVPNNVFIIGTMNTADRSVEALDTALRRRFTFQEMMPLYSLEEIGTVENIKLNEVLKTINQRIEVLIDRDHTIGHSYFIGIDSIEKLKSTFKDNIIPLLQEYFYGDYGKIGLVLGDGFVQKKERNHNILSKFRYDGKDNLIRTSFELKNIENIDFITAIKTLLNKEEKESE
ncbi:MAG TPA: hypothetical protein EYG73_05000 [Arcobacter sp.]|nr:hypothetical protein [Arcobacter sp.]